MSETLGELAGILLAVSLASERGIVLVKTMIPWLGSDTDTTSSSPTLLDIAWMPVRRWRLSEWIASKVVMTDLQVEQVRRLIVMIIGFAFAYLTVGLVVGDFDPAADVTLAGQQWPLIAIAFLATGGSAFWAQVVGYASALKDVRRLQRSALESDVATSDPSPVTGSLPQRAVAHLRRLHPGAEFLADGDVQTTSTGVRIAHARQALAGIPILGTSFTVRFGTDGSVTGAKGSPVTALHAAASSPQHTATDAARMALAELAKLSARSNGTSAPRIVRQFPGPSRPTILEVPELPEALQAELSYWPSDSSVRLAWVVQVEAPGDGEWEMVIAADGATAALLDSRKTTSHACSCRLFEFNPDVDRRDVDVPLDRSAYPVASRGPDPASFAFQWMAGDATEGNNVVCYRHNSNSTLAAQPGPNGPCFHLPDDQSTSESQQLLNAFYWCNWLHDFFLLLGFDEEAGNFQAQSPTGTGANGDRLVVRVFERGFAGIASMRSRADGKSPEMKLGSKATKPSALDAEIVVHEFVHGVTNRIIGGRGQSDPLLGRQQSEAMGEGYSDYFALTILNHLRVGRGLPESWAYGAWIAGDGTKGLRNHSYAGPVGTAADLGRDGWKDAHDAGQVWGKALIESQRVLWSHLGRATGDALGWQLVVDSLKLLTPNGRWPNMIDGRDALYEAFGDLRAAARIPGNVDLILADIRRVFSDLRLGDTARSDRGAQFKDLTPGP